MDRQPSAESVFRQAFHLHQQGKLTEAEQLYRSVLQVDPDSGARQSIGRTDFHPGNAAVGKHVG